MIEFINNYNPEKSLIFYPLTKHTRFFSETLQREYGFKAPVCVCDKNEEKWYKPAYENGPIVLSLKESIERYPDFQVFIPFFHDALKCEAEEFLISEANISHNKILNHENYIESYGCNAFVNTIFISQNALRTCCFGKFNSGLSCIKLTDNYKKDFEEILTYIKDLSKIDKSVHPCRDCPSFVCGNFSSNNTLIRRVHYSHAANSLCNFKCIYCNSHKPENKYANYRKDNDNERYKIDGIRYLIENKYISNLTTMMVFAHGEVGVFPFRDEYFDLLSNFYHYITTNSSIYIEKLHNLLTKNQAIINTSLDCGTRETFLKIKNVDAFDNVCENLTRYSVDAPNTIELKYIFLQGINDNERDINGFVTFASTIKPLKIIIAMDTWLEEPIGIGLADSIRYMIERCNIEKIPIELNKATFSKKSLRVLQSADISVSR